MNHDMVGTMSQATEWLKSTEDVNEKFNDILMDTKDIQANMSETDHLMRELAGGEEVDEEANVTVI